MADFELSLLALMLLCLTFETLNYCWFLNVKALQNSDTFQTRSVAKLWQKFNIIPQLFKEHAS